MSRERWELVDQATGELIHVLEFSRVRPVVIGIRGLSSGEPAAETEDRPLTSGEEDQLFREAEKEHEGSLPPGAVWVLRESEGEQKANRLSRLSSGTATIRMTSSSGSSREAAL